MLALLALLAAPVVVLDPGHGGEKAGAISADGVPEKRVTLKVAESARAVLERHGVRAVLTRDDDRHVSLDDRTALANRLGARVFVSIHANSSPVESRHGTEVYVLSTTLGDEVEAALLHLENDGEAAGRAQAVAAGRAGDVEHILRQLGEDVAHRESDRLARHLGDRLGGVRALGPSRGLRQAPFKVLRGARMPAVLVEIGYMTHAAQSKALASKKVQAEAGEAVARAILAYLDARARIDDWRP